MENSNESGIMYQPITADKDIRLVTLKAGTRDKEICCTLRRVSLTAKPGYEALSYVWGDDQSKRAISVDGIMIKPTKNLFDALQHLRYVTHDRDLWVDAICINQTDDNEKAKQVLLMGEIYQSTARLLIWPGLADIENESDSAIDFADRVGADLKVKSEYSLEGQNVVEVPTEDASDHDLAPWKAFMILCHRPWFTRGWIVQEVSLPESEKVYICGDKSVTWGRLSSLHISIGLYDWGQKLLLRVPEIWKSGDQGAFLDRNPYQMVYPTTSPPQYRKRSASIRDLVHEFRNQRLKDPRDKIYAFLSMATDLEPNDIEVRYGDTTVAEVYTAFAKFLLTREDPGELPLKLLSLCYHSIQELDTTSSSVKQDLLAMPSWVPDWTIGKDRRPRLLLEDIRNKDETNCSFKATLNKPMPKPAKVLDDGKTLVLPGFELGEVEEVGIDVHAKAYAPEVNKGNRWERAAILREQHLSWEQMVDRQIPNIYSNGEDRDEAYWKTLIANRNRSLKLPEVGMREAFDAWQQISRLGKHANTIQSLTDRAELWDKASPFFLAVTNATWQRLLFVTKNKQIGLTARGVRKADVICLLYGTNVPFVLRKVDGGRYTIVGEAYIYGLMDGEGILGLKDEDSVDFHIV